MAFPAAISIPSPHQLPIPSIWPFLSLISQLGAPSPSNLDIDTTSIPQHSPIANTPLEGLTLQQHARSRSLEARQQLIMSSLLVGCTLLMPLANQLLILEYSDLEVVWDNEPLGRRDWDPRNIILLHKWSIGECNCDRTVYNTILAFDYDRMLIHE